MAARNMNIMMEEEPYVRPVKTTAEKIAEIPYEDELLIGPCYDKDNEELIFNPSNENQSEQHVKELMEACPNLDREKALLWLSEFSVAEATRLAKKLCFPVLIPTHAVPGLSQLATQMSGNDLEQVLVVRVQPAGIQAVLPARVYVIPDAKFQSDIGKTFLMGFDERRYVNAPRRRPVADSDSDDDEEEEAEPALPPTPKMKKKKVVKKSTDKQKNKKNKENKEKKKTSSVTIVVKKVEKVKKIKKAKDFAITKKSKKTKEPKQSTSGKKPSTSSSATVVKTKAKTTSTSSKAAASKVKTKTKKTPSGTKKTTATVSPTNQKENEKPKKRTARRVLARCQDTSEPMEE